MKKKCWFLFEHFEEIILAPGVAIMLLINFANVLARYVFHVSWAASEELCVIGFAYITFFGAAVAVKRKMHLGFELILDKLPKGLGILVRGLIALSAIVLMALMIFYGVKVCQNQMNFGSATPAMRIPLVYASASVPLGGIAIIIRLIQDYAIDVRGYIANRE